MAEKKYFWLKMPRNFFEKHYIKILRAKDNGDLLVMFYIWMITESIDHEGKETKMKIINALRDLTDEHLPENVGCCEKTGMEREVRSGG